MWTWVTVLLTCNLTWQKINDLRLVYVHFRFSLELVLFFSLSVSISRFQHDGEGIFFWLRIFEWLELHVWSILTGGFMATDIQQRALSSTKPIFTSLMLILFLHACFAQSRELFYFLSIPWENDTDFILKKKAVTFEVFVLKIGRASICRSCFLNHRSVSAFLWTLFQENWPFLSLRVSPFL